MKNYNSWILLFACIMSFQIGFAQSDKEKAIKLGMEAVELMDNGKLDESIALLKEAQKLDPKNIDIPYEIAYANYLGENYKEVIKLIEKIKGNKDANDRVFQLLGNAYDMAGNPDKALKTYDEGLKRFPDSGALFLEKGNVYWQKKEYIKALEFYEQGILHAPRFPSNYYRATLIYCSSTEEVWGMIYGEIFMNLERNSERTRTISEVLFKTYKREINFTEDNSISVSFTQSNTISIDELKNLKNFTLPYGVSVYEPTLLLALIGEKNIDLNSLDHIRSKFLDLYFENGHNKSYPNVLFDYQNKIKEAGHLEAYNHWILMKGDEDAFGEWMEANKEKYDAFVAWFKENQLKIDNKNRFHTSQY